MNQKQFYGTDQLVILRLMSFLWEVKKLQTKYLKILKVNLLVSIAGGGHTVAVINKFKYSDGFTYLSTAGGAFLELLEGKVLPGIKALEIN